MRLYYLLLPLLLIGCQKTSRPSLSPELQGALASLEVMDGFQIELVAAEPLVADPVAMEIDERGDLYVVEMHGYPLDLSRSGIIKQLTDTDGDGFPDESTVFADSLQLPTGIMRWKNGFIVTDAPHVLYLEDTDGDGRADQREVLLTGFALSNPQHNLNTPRFGLDNWIYLGHERAITPFVFKEEFGDRGEAIRFPGKPEAPQLGINANGKAVRFRPDSYQLEALSGDTQFGHTNDPWGHRIYTSNANHLFHEVLAAPYMGLNPHLLIAEATQRIPDHGAAAEVFAITENPNHQLLTDVGVITSSCGVTWYTGGAFGEDFDRVTFIAEPVHNLVHADVIEEAGATFSARRLMEGKEFLASRDPWFRPVNFYIGPDGALYVLDYYRQIIEHPEWMSEEVTQSGALYNGADKGRIYRITPREGLPMDWLGRLDLAERTDAELAALLDSANGWYRGAAQRLLFHRRNAEVIPILRERLRSARHDEAKAPALWLLHDLDGLEKEDLLSALTDEEAGVRENAVKVLESRLEWLDESPELASAFFGLQEDTSPKVRFQLLCTLALVPGEAAEKARKSILLQDIGDPWVARAAIAGSTGREQALLLWAQETLASDPSDAKTAFFEELGATIANARDPKALETILQADPAAWWKTAACTGIGRSWRQSGSGEAMSQVHQEQLLGSIDEQASPGWRKTALDLLAITGLPAGSLTEQKMVRARQSLQSKAGDVSWRADAVRLLGLAGAGNFQQLFMELLQQDQPEEVKLAAVRALRPGVQPETCAFVLANFAGLSPDVKAEAVDLFFAKPAYIHQLLDAVEDGTIDRSDLGWRRTVRLMNYYDEAVRTHARRVLAINEDRKAVLQQYLTALDLAGDAAKGRLVFERLCAVCHQIEGVEGVDFGPNLSTLRSRNPHSIVTEIINPNNSIADQYENCEIRLKNGTQLSGIIEQENAQTIVLKQATGEKIVLQKENVASAGKSSLSAMPNGLENGLSVVDMADLVAFIRGH